MVTTQSMCVDFAMELHSRKPLAMCALRWIVRPLRIFYKSSTQYRAQKLQNAILLAVKKLRSLETRGMRTELRSPEAEGMGIEAAQIEMQSRTTANLLGRIASFCNVPHASRNIRKEDFCFPEM